MCITAGDNCACQALQCSAQQAHVRLCAPSRHMQSLDVPLHLVRGNPALCFRDPFLSSYDSKSL